MSSSASPTYNLHDFRWVLTALASPRFPPCHLPLVDSIIIDRGRPSLWLCLHLREIERGREAVPVEHVAIYRAATRCVLQQLEGAHAHVVSHLKKNNVFACALSDARA
jgi:hypothetical protein